MINKIFAAVVFLFSLIIYIATMAPTTSFWDCGEFIACSYTLGVPHPPGTPLYLLLGNVFSNLFFFIDDIGARVNLISPIVSALSVMFLYLIIVQLIRIWNKGKSEVTSISIYMSALIGSLLFAFTDSQWFNAVEAEVYGMSTFFTAIVVWLILKWTKNRGTSGNVKYIILISYIFGLAIGVHLLNLLAIPFVILIIYFNFSDDRFSDFIIDNFIFFILGILSYIIWDVIGIGSFLSICLTIIILLVADYIKYKIFKEDITAFAIKSSIYRISIPIISISIFGLIYIGVIKGLPNMVIIFEKGLSFNGQGISYLWDAVSKFYLPLFLLLFLLIGFILCLINKHSFFKKNQVKVFISSLLMIYIGFSTYTLIPIRAIQNPNINENSPDNLERFLAYMNRDQYGQWKQVDVYNILKYYLGDDNAKIDYSRIIESPHIQRWAPFSLSKTALQLRSQENKFPFSNSDIIKYVNNYQINEMYLRYFAWQFIGREYHKEDFSWTRNTTEPLEDLNGNGDWDLDESYTDINENQTWDSTIKIAEPLANVDWYRYGIPFAFIFGIIGCIYHFARDPKRALAVSILFIVTGVFIILYLNQYDPQPRERDYSYVGSFFTFSIWVGIGCMAMMDLILMLFKNQRFNQKFLLPLIISSSCILFGMMPLQYLIKDYYYHSRSGNNAAWDYAYNILNSCEPNSIIFTNGDNDTFPLWYIQEVDKIRTDVRVINLSLLNTSWYINQIYSNNALGTIDFNFNEPIYNDNEHKAFKNPDIPIFNLDSKLCEALFTANETDCRNMYFLDLNNNKTYDSYDFEETKNMIQQFEDPVLGTIYAYKRWDPNGWAEIEKNYIKFEIQQSLDILAPYGNQSSNTFNSLRNNGNTFLNFMLSETQRNIYALNFEKQSKKYLEDKYSLEQSFDQVIQGLIDNKQRDLYEGLWAEYNSVQASYYYNLIKNELKISTNDSLYQYIQEGKGLYRSSEESDSKIIWGKTPDQEGENYIIPVASFSSFNASIPLKKETSIEINLLPTLQDDFFRIQDIMIMKILEDVDKERKVYFATTVNPQSRINLNSYLINQGMVHEVSHEKQILSPDYPVFLDKDKLEKNIFDIYRFTNLNKKNIYYNSDLQRIMQNYRMLFLYLAEEYKIAQSYDKMKNVLLYMEEVMPEDVIKIHNPHLKLYSSELFYDAGIENNYENYIDNLIDNDQGSIDIALSLSKKGLFEKSNQLIKGILNKKYNLTLKDFFHSLEEDLSESIEKLNSENIETFIINSLFEKLKEHGISLSNNDETLVYSLQILIQNYNNLFLIQKNE